MHQYMHQYMLYTSIQCLKAVTCIFSTPKARVHLASPPATSPLDWNRAVLPVEQLLLQLLIGIPERPISYSDL